MPYHRRRIYVLVVIGMVVYFVVNFLLLTGAVEENRSNPYQGRAHDVNGAAIGP